ncbi:MAG: hypothetical protein LBH93_01045 [Chitinispirillales bacterium]|jgi:protein arginine kinase activator|nr:hypothetical protein [Chitinispirillales bacterium]
MSENDFGANFGDGADDDDMGGACMCDDCKVRSANVHLTHVESNESQTFHLCEECARGRGVPLPDSDVLIKGLEAITGAAGASLSETHVKVTVKSGKGGGGKRAEEEEAEEGVACAKCGMKLSEFRSSGWLGCADCYDSFEERINKIHVQVHGAGGHKGKKYGKAPARRGGKRDLERLRGDLASAVRGEEFELAASIRDAIRGLEQGVGAK